MKCAEARALLFAFLDSELDARLSLDMQLHLEQCGACAREAEIERTLRKHLAHALDSGPQPDQAEDRRLLEGTVGGEHAKRRPPAFGRRRALWIAALSAAASVLAALSLHFSGRHPPGGAPLSAGVLLADFEHFLASGRPLHVASEDPHALASFLRAELDTDVAVPEMKGNCRLVGARTCTLAGRPAALALYDMEGSPAALVVARAGPGDIGSAAGSEPGYAVERLGDATIVACRREGLTYAALGRVSERELLELIPGAEPPRK